MKQIRIHIRFEDALMTSINPRPLVWMRKMVDAGVQLRIGSHTMTNRALREALIRAGVPPQVVDEKFKLFYGAFPERMMIDKNIFPLQTDLPTMEIVERFAIEKQREKDARFRG